MGVTLFFPGDLSPWVTLADVLRERHDEARARVVADIEARKKARSTVSTEIDWVAVGEHAAALAAAAKAGEAAAALEAAQAAVLCVDGKGLTDPGEFEPTEGHEAIKLRFRALSADESSALVRAVVRSAGAADEEALREHHAALGAYITRAVAEMQTPTRKIAEMTADVVEALKISGLLVPVFYAARDYQGLSVGKGGRFGSEAPAI